jgi:hypothetical protein
MRLRITKAIVTIADNAFKGLLAQGAFPKARYSSSVDKSGHRWEEYSLFEYCDAWGKFTKILDKWMKQEGLDPELGIYTRKHNAEFLAKVKILADEITELDVVNQKEHFHTFADSILESI